MTRPVYVGPEADRDVGEIREYLRGERERAAAKFESRWTKLLIQLESMPYLGGRVWRNVRCVKVRGFRYVVYYVVTRKRLEVYAVVHGSREPRSWKSRF